jgi:hypothetical protein
MQMGRDESGLRYEEREARISEAKTDGAEQHQHKSVRAKPGPNDTHLPGTCPHCGARLSSLDVKMNKCFKCWAVLDADAAVKPRQGHTGLEVHI